MVFENFKKRIKFLSCAKSEPNDSDEELNIEEKKGKLSCEEENKYIFKKEPKGIIVIADGNRCNVETSCAEFHVTLSFDKTEYIVKKSTKNSANEEKLECCLEDHCTGKGQRNETSSEQSCSQNDSVKIHSVSVHCKEKSMMCESGMVKCSQDADDKSSGYTSISSCPSSKNPNSDYCSSYQDKETYNSRSLIPTESAECSDSLEISSLFQSDLHVDSNEHSEQENYMGSSLRKGSISNESDVSCIESQNLKCVDGEQDPAIGSTMWLHQSQVMTNSSSLSSDLNELSMESIQHSDEKRSQNNFQNIHLQEVDCSISRVVSSPHLQLHSSVSSFSSVCKHLHLSPLQSWSSLNSLPSFGTSDETVSTLSPCVCSVGSGYFYNISQSVSRKYICPHSKQLSSLTFSAVEMHRDRCASEMFNDENSITEEYERQKEQEKSISSSETLHNFASSIDNKNERKPLAYDHCTVKDKEDSNAQIGSPSNKAVHKIHQELWEKPLEGDDLLHMTSPVDNMEKACIPQFNMVKDREEKQLIGTQDRCHNKLNDQSLPQFHDQKHCQIMTNLDEHKIPQGSGFISGKNKDLGQNMVFIREKHAQEIRMNHNEEIFAQEQCAEMEVKALKIFIPIEDKVKFIEPTELGIRHKPKSIQGWDFHNSWLNIKTTENSLMGERNISATLYRQLFILKMLESLSLGMIHHTLHHVYENKTKNCFKEKAKIHFAMWKEVQEHYFNVKETMWIYFLPDISDESSLRSCEFQYLLLRLCPWMVPRIFSKYEIRFYREKEVFTCISYPTSCVLPLKHDDENKDEKCDDTHCIKDDIYAKYNSLAVNTACRVPQQLDDENRDSLLPRKATCSSLKHNTGESTNGEHSFTSNSSTKSTDSDLMSRTHISNCVNMSTRKMKPKKHTSKYMNSAKKNDQALQTQTARRRNKIHKGPNCSLVPGKVLFGSTTWKRSSNDHRMKREGKCHNLVKIKISQHSASQNENVPNSVNTIMDDFNDRNPSDCTNHQLSFSSLPYKSPVTDNLILLVSLQNSTSHSRRHVHNPLKYQHNLSAEKFSQIKKHLVRFFQRYEATKHRHSMSQVSMEKIENMSVPQMLFKIQSIPKGLSFLRDHLKISKNYQLVSVDVVPLQQPNQETDLDNFLQQVVDGDDEAVQSRMRLEWFRIITFQTYPANVGISTLKLAHNGFYYTGHTTETRCYFCRQTYNEWSAESNIEAVHRQISPGCPFINGRETNNVPIHGGRSDSSVLDSSMSRTATEQLRNSTLGSPNTVSLPQAQSRQSPPPAISSGASADGTSADQGSEQEPASMQAPSKSKLKRDKKKKKKEEQAKAKAAASTNQGAGGSVIHEVPHSEEEVVPSIQSEASVTSTSSSEPTTTPGLTVEEIQPHSRSLGGSHGEGAQATSVSIAPSVPPVSIQSSQTSSAQNTTNTRSSTSSANRQGGANPPGPSQSGANPPAPTSAERLAQLDPLGINFDKPKYPAYAVYSTRLSSFEGWPSHMAQTPREMARAGYFYAGYGDYARCFFCGGGLRNWDRTDEPWIEHAKWFPRCAFLRNNKGDKYVARVQRRHQEQEAGLEPSSQLPPPVERDMETSIAQALREMGYNNQIIQRAMNDWRRNLRPGRRHPPPMTASAILDIIEILESQEQVNTQRPRETPLIIPGVDSLAGEVNRVHLGNDGESMNSLGASALDENRTDARLDDQPREYGYDQREKQEKQILQEDFLGLTETIVCKVCCDKDVAAAFLPCGHLVCCLDCAPAMRKCPLCGELIKGTVKTYFA